MARPYLDLRYAMAKRDWDAVSAAKRLGISPETFSRKMNLKTTWTLYEAYQLCLLSGRKLEELPELFPLKSVNEAEANRQKRKEASP